MWTDESVFYQIYPLGLCGAPAQNDGVTVPRIRKIGDWISHILACGCNAVWFCPVFESDAHGYDTRDYAKLDCRLGTNRDFAAVCGKLHESGIRVVLDGVFNHVGRGFWAFEDVCRNRQSSRYKNWFFIDFGRDSNYHDGFWYEGWEGHYELVKLNLRNEEVVRYLFGCIEGWVKEFGIDGLRLDVAYCLDRDFLSRLRSFCDGLKKDFFLVGEILSGDYRMIMNDGMLHSATNYECCKGLYSSFNSMNLFEIGYSLNRQFGPESWALYRGAHLLNFADNHDVTRVASQLKNPKHLPLLYAILFGMPGIPCLYYGSEWGVEGRKEDGDAALRPALEKPEENDLTRWIAACANAKKSCPALLYGGYRQLLLTNRQIIFERASGKSRVLVAANADSSPYTAHFDAGAGRARDLISGEVHDFGGGSVLPPYSAFFWEIF